MTQLAVFIVVVAIVAIAGIGIGMLVASGMQRLDDAAETDEEDADDRSG